MPGDRTALANEAERLHGAITPYGVGHDGPLTFHAPKSAIYPLADWLIQHGAETVTTINLDDVFEARNPLYERLMATLPAAQ